MSFLLSCSGRIGLPPPPDSCVCAAVENAVWAVDALTVPASGVLASCGGGVGGGTEGVEHMHRILNFYLRRLYYVSSF